MRLWLDLARVLVGSIILVLLLVKLVLTRPYYLETLRPRFWRRVVKRMGLWDWQRLLCTAIVFAGLIFFVVLFITMGIEAVGWRLYSEEEYIFIKVEEISWPVLLVSVNILPIFEEWFFRGVLLEEIALRSRSRLAGVVGSSLVFAVFHLSNPGTYPAFTLPLIGAGFLLGVCYLLSGLGGAILSHNVYNSILVILRI